MPHVGWDGLPISFPRVVVRRGPWNERHQWTERCVASMGFQWFSEVGRFGKLEELEYFDLFVVFRISGIFSTLFSTLTSKWSSKNTTLATYVKRHEETSNCCIPKHWTSTFEWLQVPVKPELTNYGMADPRTVRVLDPSIFDHRGTSSVICSDQWGETLGIDLGPFSGSCWTGTPGIWIEIPVSAFCESKISEADLNILHLVSILYPCTVLWR